MPKRHSILVVLLGLTLASSAAAQNEAPDELGALDLEALGSIRVTSVSRRSEPIANAAAAVTVLTRDDIRRSGAVTLPGVLRLVPGLQVARVGSRDWAVSARGFNTQSANKLLVLVDGRTVYSPIFAGVFWDAVAFPLDEIDRIEVIRGPGATMWGANAVNGVVNVITRSAGESRGGRLALGGGDRLNLIAGARYGWRTGGTDVRVHAGMRDRDPSVLADGSDAFDDWTYGSGGFRADGRLSDRDEWTLQGDAYAGTGGHRLLLPADDPPYTRTQIDDLDVRGANLLGRWTRSLGAASELSVQLYYDRAERVQAPLFGTMTVDQVDAQLQHRLPVGTRHDVTWGLEYRVLSDEVTGARAISFDPASRTTQLVSGWLQDEISLVPGRLGLTLGAKVEYNDYTGAEFQPNIRALLHPGERQSLWAAVSGAARTPSRIDADAVASAAITGSPVEARLIGSDDFEAERLVAYEAGYRFEPSLRIAFDAAVFYNDYTDLRTIAPGAPVAGDPRPVVNYVVMNGARARTYGFELAATWRPSRHVRVRAGYSRLEMRTALAEGAPANSSLESSPGDNPEHQAEVWTSFDLPAHVELDLIGRYVAELPRASIPSYVTADVRLGWAPVTNLDLSVVVEDLLQEQHAEFATIAFIPDNREFVRRAYVKAVWRF